MDKEAGNIIDSGVGTGGRSILAAASIVVVIVGLQAAQAVLVPILFAFFLAILGIGPLIWLQARRVPKILGILLLTICLIGIFAAVAIFLGNSINDFTSSIPRYEHSLLNLITPWMEWLNQHKIEVSSGTLVQSLNPAQLLNMFGRGLRGLMSALSQLLLVLFCFVFMLVEAASFKEKLQAVLGDEQALSRFSRIAKDVHHYLAIKTLMSALTGFIVWIWVVFMGVDYPALWGFSAFVLNYVPYIGSIIASIPAVLLCAVQHGIDNATILAIGYIIINVSISNFIEPVLMGRKLGISVLVVFLSLVFWGWIWGPAGALMSVPLTMIVKILLEHSEDLRWISRLMDSKVRLS